VGSVPAEEKSVKRPKRRLSPQRRLRLVRMSLRDMATELLVSMGVEPTEKLLKKLVEPEIRNLKRKWKRQATAAARK
jgi:hypothetical protein